MNRWKIILAAGALLLAAARTQGGEATTSSVQPIRIAYVDLDRIAKNSDAVRNRVNTIEKDLSEKQKNYETKASELRQLRDQLLKQESVLTPAQTEQLKERIRKLRDEMDYLEYESSKIMSNTSRDVIEPVLDQVLVAVERVANAYKIDLVLRGDLVLFASERVDLTDTVVRELDRAAKTAPAPVSPASSPARRSSEEEKKLTPGAKPGKGPASPVRKTPRVEDGSPK